MWLVKKIAILRNRDIVLCSERYAEDFDKAYNYVKSVSPSSELHEENIGFSISYEGLFGAGSFCDAEECTYKYLIYEIQNVDTIDDI